MKFFLLQNPGDNDALDVFIFDNTLCRIGGGGSFKPSLLRIGMVATNVHPTSTIFPVSQGPPVGTYNVSEQILIYGLW